MSAFISWSGENSAVAGSAFHQLLRHVLQGLEVFISSDKIRSGQLWFPEIQRGLESAKYGVVIATREAVQSPWVLFESGAIWKAKPGIAIGILLIGLVPDDLRDHPLAQFQARKATKDDVLRLILDMRDACGLNVENDVLSRAFELNWEEFAKAISSLPEERVPAGLEPATKDERLDQIGDRLSIIEEFILSRSQTDTKMLELVDRVLQQPRPIVNALAPSGGLSTLGSSYRSGGLLSRALGKPLVSGHVSEGEGPTVTTTLMPEAPTAAPKRGKRKAE